LRDRPVRLRLYPQGCGHEQEVAGRIRRHHQGPLGDPNFNLRPPLPGAPPANSLDPSSNAELALFSNADTQTVANNMRGTYTPGERMLLANAKAQAADPGIRARLNADQRAAVQNADRSFTDRILSTSATRDTGKPVNADAEVAKGSKTATPKKKESGGWFDWF
jgi:hypothetical protein